jgi:hypothetical protein
MPPEATERQARSGQIRRRIGHLSTYDWMTLACRCVIAASHRVALADGDVITIGSTRVNAGVSNTSRCWVRPRAYVVRRLGVLFALQDSTAMLHLQVVPIRGASFRRQSGQCYGAASGATVIASP